MSFTKTTLIYLGGFQGCVLHAVPSLGMTDKSQPWRGRDWGMRIFFPKNCIVKTIFGKVGGESRRSQICPENKPLATKATWPVQIYRQPSDETLGVPRAPEFCLIPCFCHCATHCLPKGHKPSGPCVHLLGQCVLPMSNACCCIQQDDELFMAELISLFCARASRGSVSACTSAITCLPLELRAQFGAWNRLCRLKMAYRGGNESGSLGTTLFCFSLPRDSLSLSRECYTAKTKPNKTNK